ncbi:hypothetical protein ACFVYA_39280 [Amycolatopsis sp. NPDC058278]|uniref:hypothetical protein n=1 Tax=Amycolatopsis sp. NPDC058278 TaxID=3346417 RepID=UPI0036DCD783
MGTSTKVRRRGSGHRVKAVAAVAAAAPGSGTGSDVSLSTDKPGGIQHVIIELTDVAHGNTASGDCWKSESLCRSRS